MDEDAVSRVSRKCACGVPGTGNAIRCHRAYYGTPSTYEIGGKGVRKIDACRCACHDKAA